MDVTGGITGAVTGITGAVTGTVTGAFTDAVTADNSCKVFSNFVSIFSSCLEKNGKFLTLSKSLNMLPLFLEALPLK